MARQIRLEYEGAIYHVMNRGDRQEAIFEDDQDRESFLATLDEARLKSACLCVPHPNRAGICVRIV